MGNPRVDKQQEGSDVMRKERPRGFSFGINVVEERQGKVSVKRMGKSRVERFRTYFTNSVFCQTFEKHVSGRDTTRISGPQKKKKTKNIHKLVFKRDTSSLAKCKLYKANGGMCKVGQEQMLW